MKSYTFYTVNTVVDIGNGNTPPIVDGEFTSAMNLARIIECIMEFDRPMMVSITQHHIDLGKHNNSTFYDLPASYGDCTVSTLKFALPVDADIKLHGVPLVQPTTVNGTRINKFSVNEPERNISINKQTFS